jgi:hypothetical protein
MDAEKQARSIVLRDEQCRGRDRKIFAILCCLIPPMAAILIGLTSWVVHSFANPEGTPAPLPTLASMLWLGFLSYIFWGPPALSTAVLFGSLPNGQHQLAYLKVSGTAFIMSLAYTLAGCTFVSVMVLDRVSVKYCVDRSFGFLKALPPAAFAATLICCWIANAIIHRDQVASETVT